MKTKMTMLFTFIVVFFIFSCASTGSGKERAQDSWHGIYAGIIPAADASGIDVMIILRSDETYVLIFNYIDHEEDEFISSGKLKWDEEAKIITLEEARFPPYYKVGKGTLTQLDIFGNEITGMLAENYILRKVNS